MASSDLERVKSLMGTGDVYMKSMPHELPAAAKEKEPWTNLLWYFGFGLATLLLLTIINVTRPHVEDIKAYNVPIKDCVYTKVIGNKTIIIDKCPDYSND